ncbi:tryptophan synthase subunit alpha [Lysobacter pythonis]|uniref:Tryptophan synthase alpha chain n=1 Tax=Solilutibacter pythonis TaxID=2483112 RepID=A0A3M2HZ11_9GAMM|nr:tryptophan synthase subunit alpha [Lysobacter pythonis]RMH94981.1 tryptophan synthase subunit alpha [Lysobacter pythonis]
MSRLQTRFAELQARGRKALVPFVTAGDPALEATVSVMHALVEAGADVIELGVPFSDPMADGPVIQQASERAIARGAGLGHALAATREFRRRDADTPVVLMGYLNPVEIRGAEAFAREAADCGIDGVLLVDLPPEEAGPFRAAFGAAGIALIWLASPTTEAARLAMLNEIAEGYLYYVSYAGVTGADRLHAGDAGARLASIRVDSPVPVLAGFGIKDAESAAAMAKSADGVVVGSALVAALAEARDPAAAARRAADFLAPLRAALDGGEATLS